MNVMAWRMESQRSVERNSGFVADGQTANSKAASEFGTAVRTALPK
jgi:hypothetical protein